MRGISEMARFTPAAVEAKYGLTPAQYPDFAALRGDPSDNLPGIPGVGEKTATKWIAEFGSLAQLVDRVDEVKGKAGDALREHLAGVLRNSQLTQLVREVPLEAARPTCGRCRGSASRSTSCSTHCSSGCSATGCTRRCRTGSVSWLPRPMRRPVRRPRSTWP